MASNVRNHPLQAVRLLVLLALFPAAVLLLQGCGTRSACSIDDIYGLIQVDGRTGLSKNELHKAGVRLCARHLRKEETYADDACVEPEQVFTDGRLDTYANGDTNALLLVWCPNTAYPRGKELQRVTCSDDYLDESDDGTVEKALHLRFDNYQRAANCLLGGNATQESDANAKMPEQTAVLERENQDQTVQGKNTAQPAAAATAGKVMRGGDHVALVAPAATRADGSELLLAATAAAVVDSDEAGVPLGKIDVDVQPHGMINVQRHRDNKRSSEQGGRQHRRGSDHDGKHHKQAASWPMARAEHHGPDPRVRPGPLFRTEATTEHHK